MKIVNGKIALLILTGFFPFFSVFSQTPKPPDKAIPRKGTPAKTTEPPCYSNEPFDAKAVKLAAKYRGNDLLAITGELARRARMEKDEFETTKQFKDRLAVEMAKNLVGGLNAASVMAFLIEAGTFKYDADAETMNYEVVLSPSLKWSAPCPPQFNSVTFKLRVEKFKSIGENTFPITALKFKVELERARKLKPNLAVLLIGRAAERNGKYVKTDYDYGTEIGLNFDPAELWIYDTETGEVYSRIQDGFKEIFDKYLKAVNADDGIYAEIKKLYDAGYDDEAVVKLRRLLLNKPMEARAYLWLGRIHLRQNEIDNAVNSLKTAVFWDNRLVEADILLAKIFLEKGDCSQAMNYFNAAEDIDAANKEVSELKPRIEACRK